MSDMRPVLCILQLMALMGPASAFYLNGFMHLSFLPDPLVLSLGSQASGYVNVSVDEHAAPNLPLRLGLCCLDTGVAVVAHPRQYLLIRNLSALVPIQVRGLKLGRTSLKFYITRGSYILDGGEGDEVGAEGRVVRSVQEKTTSLYSQDYVLPAGDLPSADCAALHWSHGPVRAQRTSRDTDPEHRHLPRDVKPAVQPQRQPRDTDSGRSAKRRAKPPDRNMDPPPSAPNTSSDPLVWWIPEEYEVVVGRPDMTAATYLQYVIMVLVGLNLVGVGGQVDGEEMINLLKRPMAVCVGLFCRFGIIPALGLGLVEMLQPSRPASLGVLALTCAPSEGASTLMIQLAELDLTLSVTVTSVNNFAGVAMIPLWTILFENRIYSSPGNVNIPFRHIFILFGYMTTCMVVGYVFYKKSPSWSMKYWTYLPSVTVVSVVFTILVEIYSNYFVFPLVTVTVFFQSLMLAVSGFMFSAAVAFIARQSHNRIGVLALETGVRTTYATGLLLSHTLEPPDGDVAMAAPVLCAFFSLLPTFALMLVYRVYIRYKKNKYAGTDCSYLGSTEDLQGLCNGPEVVDAKETCM